MKKQDKVKKIHKILDELYPKPQKPLNHKDAYTLLIAVLLSARCTDKKVNEVTPELFKIADNPKDMSKNRCQDDKKNRQTLWTFTTEVKSNIKSIKNLSKKI